MLTRSVRATRGHRLTVAGGVLTGIGAVMILGSLVPLASPEHDCDDLCGLDLLVITAPLAAIGTTLLTAGVPLFAVGTSATGKSRLTIDSIGPQALRGGGGLGIAGRL